MKTLTFKQYITENENKTYYVLVPGGDPKYINSGSSIPYDKSYLMPNDISTMYKDMQYFLSEVSITLIVKFKVKPHPKLKNISMQNYTEPDPNEYDNPRKYAPIKEYEIPYMQLIDIIDIEIRKFKGVLALPVQGRSWHRTYNIDLPANEKNYIISKALDEFTEELKERFKGLCNGTKPLEEPFREKYSHRHEFRQIVKTVIKYIKRYNLI